MVQCGSRVRNSLYEAESEEKFVYVIDLEQQLEISRIKLKTVRPFLMDTIKVTSKDTDNIIRKKIELISQLISFCLCLC